MAVCVGMVIGTGIFRTTPLAAEAVSSPTVLLSLWAFGGAMSLAGALCFAEMAAAFPDAGGDYFFLRKAFGETLGFLFAWSRFAVIHTGSMALVAFALGDYVAEVLSVGASTSTVVRGARDRAAHGAESRGHPLRHRRAGRADGRGDLRNVRRRRRGRVDRRRRRALRRARNSGPVLRSNNQWRSAPRSCSYSSRTAAGATPRRCPPRCAIKSTACDARWFSAWRS